MKFTNVSWNVKQFVRMIDNGGILFDYPIQRAPGQWKLLQKSYLIHTLADELPVPPVYFLREDIKVDGKDTQIRWVLDGVQRLSNTHTYIKNEYALHKDTPKVQIEGEIFEIAGKTFEELDEIVQDMIFSRNILGYTVDSSQTTDEEIEDCATRFPTEKVGHMIAA